VACYHPWSKDDVLLPCGQCIGCRLEYARGWAVRIMLEASLHERNSFVTLTYDDEHLPKDGSLSKRAFPEFMARLRRARPGRTLRYFHCGEYGEKRRRPHYHAVLFGEDFSDCRAPFVRRGSKFPEWIAPDLMELWPMGQSLIGSVSFESASYVARYVCAKKTGRLAKEAYESFDPKTGEILQLVPEFATMSRRPGIGHGWAEKYGFEVYPSDELVVSGVRMAPPRYFDKLLEREYPDLHAQVVHDRRVAPPRKGYEKSAERLHVREVCAESRLNLLRRDNV